MNARDLYAGFPPSAGRVGRLPVHDDRTALAFVDRARQAGLAISAIEMLRGDELGSVEPPAARILGGAERMSSWDDARSFIEMVAGRGLHFLVVVESPWSTRLARVRSAVSMLVRDSTSHRLPQ